MDAVVLLVMGVTLIKNTYSGKGITVKTEEDGGARGWDEGGRDVRWRTGVFGAVKLLGMNL